MRMVESLARRPRGAQPAHYVDDHGGLFDCVDRTSVPPRRLAHLGMARAAGYPDDPVLAAAAGDPDVEAGRLGHDARVGEDAALDDGGAPRARGLLVRVGGDDEVAGEVDAERREDFRGNDHRGDAALHVAGPAPVQRAVTQLRVERIARPALLWLGRDDVDVAVEEKRAAVALAAEPRDELGTPLVVQPRR